MAVSYDSVNVANVRNAAFGASGNGSTDDTKAVAAARDSLAGGGTVYFPPGKYRIAADLVFPPSVTLMFSNGASLVVDGGRSVAINGAVDAGLYPIFGGAGAVTGLQLAERVYPQWWGAAANAQSDQTAAFQSALNTGKPVYVVKGVYKINRSLQALSGVAVTLTGEPGAVLDGTASAADTLVHIGGRRIGSAPLDSNAAKGTSVLSTALSAVPGDVLLVTSTEAWNGPYNKGELVEVSTAAAGTVTLKTPLYDNYNSASTTVYLLSTPKVRVEEIEIRRNSNQAGLWIEYSRDVVVKRCTITGARERCFYLSYVYGGIVEDNNASDFWYPNTGTSYGLAVASSQNIIERDNTFTGGRHAIAHGGWEPVRDVVVEHNLIDNYHASSQPSLDFHGNTEFITVRGNTIRNGVIFLGRNIRMAGNFCYGENRSAIHYWPSLSGSYCLIENNVIDTENASNPDAFGISFLAYAANVTVDLIRIAGNRIRTKMRAISIQPYSAAQTGVTVSKLELADNDVSSTDHYSLIIYRSGTTKLRIGTLDVTNGTYAASGHSMLFDADPGSGSATFTGATVSTRGNGTSAVDSITGFAYVEFSGCVFSGGPSAGGNTFNNPGTLKLTDNRFTGFSVTQNVSVPGDFYEKDNIFTNSPGFAIASARTLTESFANGNAEGRGTAAPNSGIWKAGDRFWNVAPTLTRNISHWTCIAGGAPGVWTAHGTGFGLAPQRPALGPNDAGYAYYDRTVGRLTVWSGSAWM